MNYAEEIIEAKSYPKLKDLIILAKYYRYKGYNQSEIKTALISFCKERESDWNAIRKNWKIKIAVEESEKYNLRIPSKTPITKAELDAIEKVKDYDKEKILFVLLVLAKFLKYNNTKIKISKKPRQIGLYYVNEDLIKIFQHARIKSVKKYRNKLSHELYDSGYIDGTVYNGIVVKYVQEDSPTSLFVSDYENIVLAYQRYKGENIAGCSCGRLFIKKTKRYLCPVCQKHKRMLDKRKSEQKRRETWTD